MLGDAHCFCKTHLKDIEKYYRKFESFSCIQNAKKKRPKCIQNKPIIHKKILKNQKIEKMVG